MRNQALFLRFERSIDKKARQKIDAATRAATLVGRPIRISALPRLSAHRGKLLSGELGRGTPVHAATFIRRRQIILESELLRKRDLGQIVVHELFHFVWARLGNKRRAEFTSLIESELSGKARGEIGESAGVKKSAYLELSSAELFRDYVCESFCDTAGWMYCGTKGSRHVTLAARWQRARHDWFEQVMGGTAGRYTRV